MVELRSKMGKFKSFSRERLQRASLKTKEAARFIFKFLRVPFITISVLSIWMTWDNVSDSRLCHSLVGKSFNSAGHSFRYIEADYRWWGRKYTYTYTSRDLKTVKNLVRCAYRIEVHGENPTGPGIIWMRALPGIVYDVLHSGTNPALFIDTDALVTRPVTAYGDFVVSKEFVNGMNTGYVLIKRNEKVLEMVTAWKNERPIGQREHDQDILSRMERQDKIRGIVKVPVFSHHIHTIYSAENWGKWPTFFFLRRLVILEMWTEKLYLAIIAVWALISLRRYLKSSKGPLSLSISIPVPQISIVVTTLFVFLATRTVELNEVGFWNVRFYGIPGVFRSGVIADMNGLRIDLRSCHYFNIGRLLSHEAGIFVYDASALVDQIATTVVFLLGAELIMYKLLSRTKFSSFSVLNCCQPLVQKHGSAYETEDKLIKV